MTKTHICRKFGYKRMKSAPRTPHLCDSRTFVTSVEPVVPSMPALVASTPSRSIRRARRCIHDSLRSSRMRLFITSSFATRLVSFHHHHSAYLAQCNRYLIGAVAFVNGSASIWCVPAQRNWTFTKSLSASTSRQSRASAGRSPVPVTQS